MQEIVNEMMPLVSVVIPTFNRKKMLLEAIDSVVEQTYKNVEIIVIDDGSSDGSGEAVRSLTDSRIRYYWKENAGVSSARNYGVEVSNGKYVSFLDSDDVYERFCIEEKIKKANDNPECVVVGGGCTYFCENEDLNLLPTPPRMKITYEDLCIFTAFPGGCCNFFAKKEAFLEVGGFSCELKESEDRDLLRRLAQIGGVVSVDRNTVSIRVHPEFRPGRDRKSVFSYREQISAKIPEILLRRKSRAWNRVVVGNYAWDSGNKAEAIFFWIKSFIMWPFGIHKDLPRLRIIARDYLLKRQ